MNTSSSFDKWVEEQRKISPDQYIENLLCQPINGTSFFICIIPIWVINYLVWCGFVNGAVGFEAGFVLCFVIQAPASLLTGLIILFFFDLLRTWYKINIVLITLILFIGTFFLLILTYIILMTLFEKGIAKLDWNTLL